MHFEMYVSTRVSQDKKRMAQFTTAHASQQCVKVLVMSFDNGHLGAFIPTVKYRVIFTKF